MSKDNVIRARRLRLEGGGCKLNIYQQFLLFFVYSGSFHSIKCEYLISSFFLDFGPIHQVVVYSTF